jgi:hypothetical protein
LQCNLFKVSVVGSPHQTVPGTLEAAAPVELAVWFNLDDQHRYSSLMTLKHSLCIQFFSGFGLYKRRFELRRTFKIISATFIILFALLIGGLSPGEWRYPDASADDCSAYAG